MMMRSVRLVRRVVAAALFLALAALPAPASPGRPVRLFRPLLADPRENQFRMKWVRSTEDWRYGADIADSTSSGGIAEDRKTVTWDVGFGETFRADPWTNIFGRNPGWWKRYQVGIPAGVFANFDRAGADLINADYQFGLSADWLLRGDVDERDEIAGFDKSVWVLRVMGFHRSTHLGDEYIANGAFDDNQSGLPDSGKVFERPPVKRYNLSFESARIVLSAERAAPRWLSWGQSTVRGYLGFEKKLKIATHKPANFVSPIYQVGFEYRSQGNAETLHDGWFSHVENWIYPRGHHVDTEWLAAVDFKLAKPYQFSLADAPPGATQEAWTNHLWSDGEGGHEFRHYAGSWHAMVGIATYQRSERRIERGQIVEGGRRGSLGSFMPQEAILGLDWYYGYSPNGQFLDQRLRYRPTFIPSVTVHF